MHLLRLILLGIVQSFLDLVVVQGRPKLSHIKPNLMPMIPMYKKERTETHKSTLYQSVQQSAKLNLNGKSVRHGGMVSRGTVHRAYTRPKYPEVPPRTRIVFMEADIVSGSDVCTEMTVSVVSLEYDTNDIVKVG